MREGGKGKGVRSPNDSVPANGESDLAVGHNALPGAEVADSPRLPTQGGKDRAQLELVDVLLLAPR
eukprot:2359657-Heterocapsa_arctica.AAC.1